MLTEDVHRLFFGLGHSIDDLLNQMQSGQNLSYKPINYPPINHKINKKTGDAIIQYALAGFKRQDIEVQVINNTLQISVKKTREQKSDDSDIQIVYNGIAKREFSQKFACAEEYQAQKAVVSFNDGILKIVIPKIPQKQKLLTVN